MCAFQFLCMCAFVLHLSCCPVFYFYLKAHSNLNALRASNTNPANFMLHEITDSCERLFQRFGIGSKVSGYPSKKIVIRSNGSGYPLEKNAIHPLEGLRTTQANPFEENFHSIEQLGLSVGKLSSVRGARVIRSKKIAVRLNGSSYPAVQNNCQPRYCSKSLSPETFATKIM